MGVMAAGRQDRTVGKSYNFWAAKLCGSGLIFWLSFHGSLFTSPRFFSRIASSREVREKSESYQEREQCCDNAKKRNHN